MAYYFKGNQGWTETITEFVNAGKERLNFSKVRFHETYGEDAKHNFWNCIIKCMELKDQKYEEILSSMGSYYNNFSIKSLDENKVGILIRRKIIRMTDSNLQFMRNNYKTQAVYFAKINISEYLKILTEELFSQEEMLALLDTDVHVSYKKQLLDKTAIKISVAGKKYQPTIKQKILEEHYDSNDLKGLLSEYVLRILKSRRQSGR